MAAIVAVVVVLGALVIMLLPRPAANPSPSSSPTPSAGSPTATVTTSASPTPSAVVPAFGFVPLWPFAGADEATAWQLQYRASGSQPWHLDAAQTAVLFSHGFLGFSEIDRVVGSVTVVGRQAWVGVGATPIEGIAHAAAVVHLVRLGSGDDVPWEVVGTRDTTLTLTDPGYGSLVVSPVRVGGRITGVDESLRVQILTSAGRVGLLQGIPAGGARTPWSLKVPFTAAQGSVLTIVVSTGGHLYDVERFAITGAHVG